MEEVLRTFTLNSNTPVQVEVLLVLLVVVSTNAHILTVGYVQAIFLKIFLVQFPRNTFLCNIARLLVEME